MQEARILTDRPHISHLDNTELLRLLPNLHSQLISEESHQNFITRTEYVLSDCVLFRHSVI